jgi:small subunit ribosomal protein S15e
MAEEIDLEAVAALRKKRQFKKFTFRGLELEKLLDLSHDELLNILHARARRRIQRGLTRKPLALIKKLRKAKTGECYKFEVRGYHRDRRSVVSWRCRMPHPL